MLYIFFRVPYVKRSAVAGRLMRKHAVNSWSCGGTVSSPWKTDKNPAERQETDMKLDFDEWYAEVEGIVRCFAQIETTKG